MKAKFIFIHCDSVLTPDTTVYSVWIGTSKREQKQLQQLQQLTKSTDYYFRQYDNEVCSYLERIHESFTDKSYTDCAVPPRRVVSLHDLLQMVKQHFFPSSTEAKGTFAFRYQVSTHFRFNHR